MATTPRSSPQRVCKPLPIPGEMLTIARFHETTSSPIITNIMDSFPANKTNATPAFLPFAPSTFSSPCDSSPENPVHSAHTSLISSVVTPEDQSPNAFPLHLHSLHPCPPELRRLEALHQPILPLTLPFFNDHSPKLASSPLVPPTLFDFVIAHPKISQTKLPLKTNFLQAPPPVLNLFLLFQAPPLMPLIFL